MWALVKGLNDELQFSQVYENAAEMYRDHKNIQETDVLGQPVLVCSPRLPYKVSFLSRIRRFLGSRLASFD